MDLSSNLILVIIVTSIATFASRFLGILTAENISDKSKIFDWFNCVAYSILAALTARMIIFPAGALLESTLLIRLIVISACIAIFIFSNNNIIFFAF